MRALYIFELYLAENTFFIRSVKNKACVCTIIIPRINDINLVTKLNNY